MDTGKCWAGLFLAACLLLGMTLVRYERTRQEPTEESESQAQVQTETETVKVQRQEETAAAQTEQDVSRTETGTEIRVLLCSDEFTGYGHTEEQVVFADRYVCQGPGGSQAIKETGEMLSFTQKDLKEGECWILEPVKGEGGFSLPLLKRGYENPFYRGSLCITGSEEGLILVNTLDVETYLRQVVCSEMPASYPAEALKAQAVCARTYAYTQMKEGRLREWDADVDDSTGFQVYNNVPEQEATDAAVADTAGMILEKDGILADASYYSTSCGLDFSKDLSEEEAFETFFLADGKEDWEQEEPWYRWQSILTEEEVNESVKKAGLLTGPVRELTVEKREETGRVCTLRVAGEQKTETIQGEYSIRRFLKPRSMPVTLQDGSEVFGQALLPSAFFVLTKEKDVKGQIQYQITGGGYGHGEGMSQNGAKQMAEAGESFKAILKYYYGEVTLYEKSSGDCEKISGQQ